MTMEALMINAKFIAIAISIRSIRKCLCFCSSLTRNQLLQEFLALICSKCNFAAEAEAMEHYLSRATILAIQSLVAFMKMNQECYASFLNYINESNLTGPPPL